MTRRANWGFKSALSMCRIQLYSSCWADRMKLFAPKLKVNQEVYQWATCSLEVRQTSKISVQWPDPRSADYSDAVFKTYSSDHVKPKLNQLLTESHVSAIRFSWFSSYSLRRKLYQYPGCTDVTPDSPLVHFRLFRRHFPPQSGFLNAAQKLWHSRFQMCIHMRWICFNHWDFWW